MAIDLTKIATNLELGEHGIWKARTSSSISYPAGGNEDCYTLEDVSFWFRHRNECILYAVHSFPPPGAIFDIGGGNGYVARRLQDAGYDVVVVEPGETGVLNAARRGVKQIIQSTLYDAGFLPFSLPGVGMFDVLEHVQDDRAFLQELRGRLVGGGRLYLTVPAFRWLWSQDDAEAGHWRRYTLGGISQLLSECGYDVEFATYFFRFLPLPILLLRTIPFRLGVTKSRDAKAIRSDHEAKNALVGWFARTLTRREFSKISSGRKLRMGGSCLVVARTKTSSQLGRAGTSASSQP